MDGATSRSLKTVQTWCFGYRSVKFHSFFLPGLPQLLDCNTQQLSTKFVLENHTIKLQKINKYIINKNAKKPHNALSKFILL